MTLGAEVTQRRPAGCVGTAARVIYFVAILAAAYVLVTSFDRARPPAGGDTQRLILSLASALDVYREGHDAYPPDHATGLHKDLDLSAECLVYFLDGRGRGQGPPTGTLYYEFSSEQIRDADGDGFLEAVDSWGRPFLYNTGPRENGPFNQRGAPRRHRDGFDLLSAGPDGKLYTPDDICH